MTPQIFLNGLRHSYFKLDLIKVMIFDECHHARGKDPYACIMTVSYLSPLYFPPFTIFLFSCLLMIYFWFMETTSWCDFSGRTFLSFFCLFCYGILWEINPGQLNSQVAFACSYYEINIFYVNILIKIYFHASS